MAGNTDPDPADPPAPVVTKRFRDSNVASSEELHSKYSQGKLRSAVDKVIRQNQEKRPGSRFRGVVEEVVRQENTYKYQPIDHDNEIRILRLLRGKKGDALKCTLFPSSLPSTRSASKSKWYAYYALSYVWGQHIGIDRITVYHVSEERDGFQHVNLFSKPYTLYIGANLAAALQDFRLESQDINLWVDAVCINQADNEEKHAQILLMDRIYAEATSIRVWSGDRSVDTSLASDLLKLFANLRNQEDLPDVKSKAESWASLISLSKMSLQEVLKQVVFAKNAPVVWDSEAMDMERAWSKILARRQQVEPVLHEAGFDDFSIEEFFHRITARVVTAQVDFLSNVNTIQAASVDQTFETERASLAAGTRTIEYLIKEDTAPMLQSHIRSEERYTLHAPK
jgi:hypothetical protein